MRIPKLRLRGIFCALVLVAGLQGCATNHLLRWGNGENSVFAQPLQEQAAYVHPAGVVFGLPLTIVWDVATFPFQWLWGIYPFGDDLHPDVQPDDRPGTKRAMPMLR